jgi:hypothetical protein
MPSARPDTWFHRAGETGYVIRTLLWFVQSFFLAGVPAAFLWPVSPFVARVAGSLIAVLLLFRQVNGLVVEKTN